MFYLLCMHNRNPDIQTRQRTSWQPFGQKWRWACLVGGALDPNPLVAMADFYEINKKKRDVYIIIRVEQEWCLRSIKLQKNEQGKEEEVGPKENTTTNKAARRKKLNSYTGDPR